MIGKVFRIVKAILLTFTLGFWTLAALLIVLAIAAAYLSASAVPTLPAKPFGLTVTLSGRLADAPSASGWLAEWGSEPVTSLPDTLDVLRAAAKDKRVAAVRLDVSDLGAAGPAAVRDIQRALEGLKAAGKPVFVYSDFYTQAQWLVAAGATQRWMHPMGSVEIKGLSTERFFWGDALKRFGLAPDVVKMGEFKSAPEAFERGSASAAARTADEAWMLPEWRELVEESERAAGLKSGALKGYAVALTQLKAAPSQEALKRGLVTALAAPSEWKPAHEIKRWIDSDRYLAAIDAEKPAMAAHAPHVALIYAEGEIGAGSGAPIDADELSERILSVRDDPDAKALVLRINSPGGDAFAADRIYRAIEAVRKAGKPVVASMGDVAASGGYWMSLAADKILASPLTITGSIGAFSVMPKANDLMSRFGVGYDGAATPERVLSSSPWRATTPEAAKLNRALLEGVYRRFTTLVHERRGLSAMRVEDAAEGAVWTGRQALTLGLIDALGDERDAVALAKKLAGGKVDEVLTYLPPEDVRVGAMLRSWLKLAPFALGLEPRAGVSWRAQAEALPSL